MCPLSLACVLKLFVTSCYLTQTYVVVNYASCEIVCQSSLFQFTIHCKLTSSFLMCSLLSTHVLKLFATYCYLTFFFFHFMVVASIISFVKKIIQCLKIFHKLLTNIHQQKAQCNSHHFLVLSFHRLCCLFVCLFVCEFIMDETHITTNVVVMSYIASS